MTISSLPQQFRVAAVVSPPVERPRGPEAFVPYAQFGHVAVKAELLDKKSDFRPAQFRAVSLAAYTPQHSAGPHVPARSYRQL